MLRILIVFALVTPFWSLFDQKASTWILQADQMVKPEWFSSAQMQALNPALVMILIPFNNLVLYPALRRWGVVVTPLRRMGFGIAFSGFAWIAAGAIQLAIDGGDAVSIVWQMLPYVLLTFGEVLVSATGLEFAYSQAPLSMKGVIMAFWYLSVTVGNLWVLLVNATVRNEAVISRVAQTGLTENAFLMFFFAAFATRRRARLWLVCAPLSDAGSLSNCGGMTAGHFRGNSVRSTSPSMTSPVDHGCDCSCICARICLRSSRIFHHRYPPTISTTASPIARNTSDSRNAPASVKAPPRTTSPFNANCLAREIAPPR